MGKFCSNCGKKLEEKAEVCLNCGVLINNNMQRKVNGNTNTKKSFPGWAIALIIIGCFILMVFIFIFLGIFFFTTYESRNIIDDATQEIHDFVEEYEENSIVDSGTIGDTLVIDDMMFTLNRFIKHTGAYDNHLYGEHKYVILFFDVVNNSSEKRLISPLSFNGFVDDSSIKIYSKSLSSEIEGFNELNGYLDGGESISGYIAFELDEDWEDLTVYYRSISSFQKISFYIENENDYSI